MLFNCSDNIREQLFRRQGELDSSPRVPVSPLLPISPSRVPCHAFPGFLSFINF